MPLAAVLKGIDRTFEKWHARKRRIKMVNSLAYCAQEVLSAARESDPGAIAAAPAPVFAPDELAGYFRRNACQLRAAAGPAPPGQGQIYLEAAESLEQLAGQQHRDLEGLEQRLTVLEERIKAAATQARTEEELLGARREMDRQLAPYRRKMTADQLVLLEKQYLDRWLMDAAGLPRLSLFYL